MLWWQASSLIIGFHAWRVFKEKVQIPQQFQVVDLCSLDSATQSHVCFCVYGRAGENWFFRLTQRERRCFRTNCYPAARCHLQDVFQIVPITSRRRRCTPEGEYRLSPYHTHNILNVNSVPNGEWI